MLKTNKSSIIKIHHESSPHVFTILVLICEFYDNGVFYTISIHVSRVAPFSLSYKVSEICSASVPNDIEKY